MNEYNLSVLLVESDLNSAKHFQELIVANPLISEIEIAADSDQALQKIINSSPDIIFMEYPLRGKTAGKLVKFIQANLSGTNVVFVSESKSHAAEAIRSEVFNFLLKPFELNEIEKFVTKFHALKKQKSKEIIGQIIEKTTEESRIRMQTSRGFLLINPEEIIYCKAESAFTEVHFTNDRVELSFLFLSKVEEILKPYTFMKVSRSYIINMSYLRKVFRDNNTIVLSVNGKEYEVKGSKQSIRVLSKIETE